MNAPMTPAALAEARRLSEICNACRYCEGYCPVFPAMFARRVFDDGDLSYLANLCHGCKGCWHACQYAPPHEFGVNLPATLSDVRAGTWAEHAWPAGAGQLFRRNGTMVSLVTGTVLALTILATMLFVNGTVLTGAHTGPGAFYAVIPHGVMVTLGGLTFGWAALAMALGVRSYWRSLGGGPVPRKALIAALGDAATTRHLGSNGGGCNDTGEGFSQGRRHMHMAVMWGFLLCFAATSAGTLMHYLLGWDAPYPWYSLPVLLGSVGGIGIIVGCAGLFAVKLGTDPGPEAARLKGMETGFLALLFLVSLTGMALLFWRPTSAMGGLLAIHLGFVFAFFMTMPYSKFVHGLYRLAALVKFHAERGD